jgi:hypothetical protein
MPRISLFFNVLMALELVFGNGGGIGVVRPKTGDA